MDQDKAAPGYLMRNLIALDQWANVLIGGMPDETLSARSYRQQHSRFWGGVRVVLDGVFFWQDEHCRQCYQWEMARKDLPVDYRDGEDPCR